MVMIRPGIFFLFDLFTKAIHGEISLVLFHSLTKQIAGKNSVG